MTLGSLEQPDQPEPQHLVIDRDATARINLGILVAIIGVAVLGALYLQDISYKISAANVTLTNLSQAFNRQNEAVVQHSETLIRQSLAIQSLETRLAALENDN